MMQLNCFIRLASPSDYDSFAETNIITAQVETRHQMGELWPTSAPPQAFLSRQGITLMTDGCDGGLYELRRYIKTTPCQMRLVCNPPTCFCRRALRPRVPPTKPSGIQSGFPPFPLHVFHISGRTAQQAGDNLQGRTQAKQSGRRSFYSRHLIYTVRNKWQRRETKLACERSARLFQVRAMSHPKTSALREVLFLRMSSMIHEILTGGMSRRSSESFTQPAAVKE